MKDILFGNNNRVIIKKLSKRSMAADKRRNIFIIITIAFAVCLISTVAFLYTANNSQAIERIRGQYQAGCTQMNPSEITRLANNGKFEQYGYESSTVLVKYRDSNLAVSYQSSGMLKLGQWESISGKYPQDATEIIVERAFLDYYNMPQESGQVICLNIGEGEQDYVVSGILEKENTSQTFHVLISEMAVEFSGNASPYTLKFRMTGNQTPEQLKEEIASFFDVMNIPIEQTFYSSTYFEMTDLYLGSDMPVYIVALFVVVACAIVIYNIFYISVSGKLKEYGRLKVIGTTAKQLRALVRVERNKLSYIAIPIGLMAGAVISCLLAPGYWIWQKNLKYAAIISVLTFLMVIISTSKPLKMAGKVSAIEAVRTSAYSSTSGKSESKKLHRRLTPLRLAIMNFARGKKKAFVTLLSLGLTGILVMCIAAYGNSISIEEIARTQLGDGGDYLLEAVHYGEELLSLQRNNPLDSSLKDKIEQLTDVTHVTTFSAATVLLPQVKENENFLISGLTKEQMGDLLPSDSINEGVVNYETLCSTNGILLIRDTENLMKRLFGIEFVLGDKVELKTLDEQSHTFTVQGIVDEIKTGNGANFFILPEQTLHTLYPNIDNFTTCFNIHCMRDSQQLREGIFYEVTDEGIKIVSLQDLSDSIAPSLEHYMRAAYGLLIFIFLFALMNLINTLITNLLSRQKEFGIFQSVGMSDRQLSGMLSWECLIYIIGTLLIMLIPGTICSIGVCEVFSRLGTFGKLSYNFPIMAVLVFTVALLVVQAVFSIATVHYLKKHSFAERIKVIE
ncbi:MAG: ABC transporter permease [Lachnospiraceae bacterium]